MMTFPCDVSKLHRFTEGELGQEEIAEIKEHLLHCTDCSKRLREFTRINDLIKRTLAEIEIPTDIINFIDYVVTCIPQK